MYIRLKWANANTQQVTTNIYRGTTTLDRNNLGTPLVTLSNGETEYYDRTVTAGVTYYYVLEYVSADNRVKSRVYNFVADYFRGPGGNVTITGNDDYGFMGQVSFASYTDILTKLGIGRETATPSSDAVLPAYKYSVAGKVYYVATLTGAVLDFATTLAFLKRTDKLPITIDGVNYLAYPVDMFGDEFVWDAAYTNKTPVGKRDLFEYTVIPLMATVAIDGTWKGDSIGRIITNAPNVMSKATDAMARIPYWMPASNTLAWTTTVTSSQSLVIALELVEG